MRHEQLEKDNLGDSTSSEYMRSLIISDFISGTSPSRIFVAEMSPLTQERPHEGNRFLQRPGHPQLRQSNLHPSVFDGHTAGYLEFIFANICQPAEPTSTSSAVKGLDLQLADR